MAYFPVNLRNTIINPTFAHPSERIGIEVVVIAQTIGFAAIGILLQIAMNAKRTDAETNPRLFFTNDFMQIAHQSIDIVTTPIGFLRRGKSLRCSIFCKTFIIRKSLAGQRIRIEIIVHVNAIYVVIAHDFTHHSQDMSLRLRQSGIQPKTASILYHQMTILAHERLFVIGFFHRQLHAIRIDPGMNIHVASMASLRKIKQRIPTRILALLSGNETTPGFVRRFIPGIALRTHLKQHHIDAGRLQRI